MTQSAIFIAVPIKNAVDILTKPTNNKLGKFKTIFE